MYDGAADPVFLDRAQKSFLPVRYLPPQEYLSSLRRLDTSLRELLVHMIEEYARHKT